MGYGQLKPDGYIPRIADKQLERMLATFGAVEVAGTMWCGKTWTSLAFGQSVTRIGLAGPRTAAEADPGVALLGAKPHVIDEWQDVPAIWDEVRAAVDASANALLRVGSTPELIAKAAEKTLGLSEEERQSQMIEVVRGGVREVLSGLTPKQANDRAEFQNQVRQSIEETFANLGLEITALQITKISDKNGYYESLSAKEIADKRSYARQAKAEAEKEAQLVEVKNKQEAQEAQLQSKRYISDKTKETDVAIAQNDAQVQTEKAKAEQAYAIEKAIQEQTLKEKEIVVRENELKSTVIAQQNAEAQAVQIKAEADANALRIKAQADKDAQNLSTDANAYSIREQGQASADKIQVEGQANAKAQEAIAKALEQNGQVALAMAIIDKLPEISASYAQAVASIDQLTVFDGAAGVSGQTNEGLAQSLAFIKDATGIDVAELVNKRADGTTTLNRPVPIEEDK